MSHPGLCTLQTLRQSSLGVSLHRPLTETTLLGLLSFVITGDSNGDGTVRWHSLAEHSNLDLNRQVRKDWSFAGYAARFSSAWCVVNAKKRST